MHITLGTDHTPGYQEIIFIGFVTSCRKLKRERAGLTPLVRRQRLTNPFVRGQRIEALRAAKIGASCASEGEPHDLLEHFAFGLLPIPETYKSHNADILRSSESVQSSDASNS